MFWQGSLHVLLVRRGVAADMPHEDGARWRSGPTWSNRYAPLNLFTSRIGELAQLLHGVGYSNHAIRALAFVPATASDGDAFQWDCDTNEWRPTDLPS
jgi:hypothetical protein